MATVYLVLGSNLGNRQDYLSLATRAIEQQIGTIFLSSKVYETEPWGVDNQPGYLNQVIAITTDLLPEEVLESALHIEHTLGRERKEHWGARTIDIDLLAYDEIIIDSLTLTLPHPRIQERRFVLIPLSEINSSWLHPILQQTAQELLSTCKDNGAVTPYTNQPFM